MKKFFKYLKNFLFKNLFLKIISLILAIIVWLLVSGEITKGIKI